MAPDNRHARMARERGYWSMARYMKRRGYPLDKALRRLLGVNEVPLLTERAPWWVRFAVWWRALWT